MIPAGVLRDLKAIAGPEHVFTTPEDLAAYAYDGTYLGGYRPEVVVEPGCTEEIGRILSLANREGIPVVPRGGGTGVSGGALAVNGGIMLALHRLNRILEIDAANLTARVQAGVVTGHLHRQVEELGLFYPPDPGSLAVSTLGGNVAENAGGPRALKYGVTGDYVLGLEVVLPSGEVLRTGGKTLKNVSGYDLMRLLVGSEGTLGVITEVTVRLLPLPAAKQTMLVVYNDLDAACETVSAIGREKVIPTTLEIMDSLAIGLSERYRPTGLPLTAAAVLIIEVDGSAKEVADQVAQIKEVCLGLGAVEVRVAETAAEAEQLWLARRSLMGAMAGAAPTLISEDATVPRSQIPAFVRKVREISQKYAIPIPIVGHAGDGNLHPCLLVDAKDESLMARVEPCIAEMFQAALSLGGTLSGEHGIGLVKAAYLEWEHGRAGVELMRAIKRVFDPRGILNPGKMFPRSSAQ